MSTPFERKAAAKIRHKKWRDANKEKIKSRNREGDGIKHRYGMTLEDYDYMLIEQGGCCLICLSYPLPGKKLFVDHDHATGRVRGLLCNKCNVMIGLADDDIETLCQAVWYLQGGCLETHDQTFFRARGVVDKPGVVS